MNKRDKWKWVLYAGTILTFIGVFLYLLFAGLHNMDIQAVEKKGVGILEIVFDCVISEVSVIVVVVEVILFAWCKHKYSALKVLQIVEGIVFWLLTCFYQIAVKYPLNQYLVALVSLGFCIICLIFALNPHSLHRTVVRGYVKKILKKLNNDKIVSVQTYHVEKQVMEHDVVYTLNYEDSLSKASANINGILSIEYKIRKEEVTTIESVVSTYLQLADNGNDKTEELLIGVLEDAINRIKQRLATIENAKDVTIEQCCDARILLIYLSFLRMIQNPNGNTDGESLSEFGIMDGDVCDNLDVEQQLFTRIRSGLLAAAVLGEDLRYIFRYKKDGYKNGRKYCVSKIRNSQDEDSFMICLIAIKEDKFGGIRSDVMRAIGQIERKIETLFLEVGGASNA